MSDASNNLLQEPHTKARWSYYALILVLIFAPMIWDYRLAGDIPIPVLPILLLLMIGIATAATFRNKIDESYPKFVSLVWWIAIPMIPIVMWVLDISFAHTLQHFAIWIPTSTRIIRQARSNTDNIFYPMGPALLLTFGLIVTTLYGRPSYLEDAIGPCHLLSSAKWSGCQYSIRHDYDNHYVRSMIDPESGVEIVLRPHQSILWLEQPNQWTRIFTNKHIDFGHYILWFYNYDDGAVFAVKREDRLISFNPFSLIGGISYANITSGQVTKSINPEISDPDYPNRLLAKRQEFDTREVFSTDPDEIYFSKHSNTLAIKHFNKEIKIWRNLPPVEQQLNVSRFDRLLRLEAEATYTDLNPLPKEVSSPSSQPYWELPTDKNYACISFSADERYMAAEANHTVEIFDLDAKIKTQTIPLSEHTGCPVFSDDFEYLAYVISSSTKADVVSIIEVTTGETYKNITLNNSAVRWINSFSPNNERLYVEAIDDHYRRFMRGSWTLVFKID